jgi:hypothetical protein
VGKRVVGVPFMGDRLRTKRIRMAILWACLKIFKILTSSLLIANFLKI